MKGKNLKIHRKEQNNALFWRCYRFECQIRSGLAAAGLNSWAGINRLFLSFILLVSSLPQVVTAETVVIPETIVNVASPADVVDVVIEQVDQPITQLPVSPDRPVKSVRTTITFYSSDPWQTDDSPFITANGTYVHDGVAAANFLPFGTKIKLPEIFGDKIFVINDRMNRRFNQRVDIWVADRDTAFRLGLKRGALVEIYE